MKRLFLFAMLCLIGLFGSLNAQTTVEVFVGEGDKTCSTFPNYEYYNYSISQQIFTAEEMYELSGVIKSLAFRQADDKAYTRNLSVYMMNTDVEQFEGYNAWIPCYAENLVFSGDVTYPGAGEWMEIQLQNAFDYEGGNLLVCVCDNTGTWQSESQFYIYSTGSAKRAIYSYRDSYGPYDVTNTSASPYTYQDWDVNAYAYFSNQVKFNVEFEGEYKTISIKPKTIDLGDRPNGAWMRPFDLTIGTKGADLKINAVEASNSYFKLSETEYPVTVKKGNPLAIDIVHGEAQGDINAQLYVSYNDAKSVELVDMTAYAYDPAATDVYETAETIASYPFSVTPDLTTIYDNYLLPGDADDGRDVVYEMNFNNDVALSANVDGENAKIAVYTEDFNGAAGPMADNNYNGPQVGTADRNSQINDMTLPAGKYYIVASSTSDFTLNVNAEAISVPVKPTSPSPAHMSYDITDPTLSWSFGDYTVEYQLLFGTTYPPKNIAIDWTDELAIEHTFENLYNNTNYFWQVNVRNTSGTTYGDIWAFTTSFNVPKNLTASDTELYEGESTVITWDDVNNRSYRGYNIYVDSQKVNSSLVTDLSYTLDNLVYNMNGHRITVTAVYDEGESYHSNSVYVYVTGKSSITGKFYELDGVTPIAGGNVTMNGTDEFGQGVSYTFLADENGSYSGDVLVGEYQVTAVVDGYQDKNVKAAIAYGIPSTIDFIMTEVYSPVKYVDATEMNDSLVQVSWGFTYLNNGMEDFETGDFEAFDWNNEVSDYPWVITEDAYEGQYAMKSTCEGVDDGISAIEVVCDAPEDGFLGFYYKISSEQYYDYGYFYIDGVLTASMSGVADWMYKKLSVPAGTHTYRWEYKKDVLWADGEDAFFIDNITFFMKDSFAGGWMHYDDGVLTNMIGMGEPAPIYWGVSFPASEETAGYSLTKIALYDHQDNAGNYTANIYLGGETAPGTLASTQDFTLTGTNSITEINLTTPVEIDGTQMLWITLYCDEVSYPCVASSYSNNPNSDWYSFDGVEWKHALESNAMVSWIVRAYLEKCNGEKAILSDAEFKGGVSTGSLMTKADVESVVIGIPANDAKSENMNSRAFAGYNLYRTSLHGGATELIMEKTTDTAYNDNSWLTQGAGVYQWGVSATYEGNRGIEVTFSEDFEGGVIPAGWSTLNEGNFYYDKATWYVGEIMDTGYDFDYSAGAGNYSAFSFDDGWSLYGSQTAYIVTPALNINPKSVLNFLYTNPRTYSYASDLTVSISESATGPWTQIWSTNSTSTTQNQDDWREAQIDLSDYVGTYYIAFGDEMSPAAYYAGYATGIDNVSISFESPESPIVWSKPIDKDMITSVEVSARTDNEDPVRGAKIYFNNLDEDVVYTAELDDTGVCVFDSFRKGVYEFTVEKEGFISSAVNEVVEIWNDSEFSAFLTEELAAVNNLYVSPTGWAMWEGKTVGAGDEFAYSFDEDFEGWTTIDNNSDGHTWYHSSQSAGHSVAAGDSNTGAGHIMSESFCNGTSTALNPDDYIVAPFKALIGKSSVFSFWASALDNAWSEEHFGVAISTTGNDNALDFMTIAEWTLGEKKATAETRNLRQTAWTKYEVDLSEYAGEELWIAIRHFNVSDMFILTVDDAELTNTERNDRALVKYQIMLDGNVESDSLTNTFFQHENLVDGTQYTTTVIATYTMGDSEEMEYTWTKVADTEYTGVTDLKAELINDQAVISWTLPQLEDVVNPSVYTYGFENGMEGWTLIDADGDGYNWTHNSDTIEMPAHTGMSCVFSESFHYGFQAPLYPDNYMVAPVKVAATAQSKISFWACAQHYNYPQEHFGVAVSTTGNTSASDFTTIAEWTIEGKATRQTDWIKYEADLSEYAGQEIWVAIRHFNVSDMYIVVVDDVEINLGEGGNDDDDDDDAPTSFFCDFESGIEGWTTIDADNDGYDWIYSTDNENVDAYSGSCCMYSESYHDGTNPVVLHPDNYLILPIKLKIEDGAMFKFYARAQDPNNIDEYFGVSVSTSEPTVANFTSVAVWLARPGGWQEYGIELTEYVGREVWIAIRHFNCFGEYRLNIDDVELSVNNRRDDEAYANAEMLGVMIYRNGNLISNKPVKGETYTDTNGAEGDEYCVRVVYDGAKDVTYYAMSEAACTEVVYDMPCDAPKNLYGEAYSQGGEYGAHLVWPYEDPNAWMYYDDGTYVSALGTGEYGNSFYWGVMFPTDVLSQFAGRSLTQVSMFDYLAHTGNFYIFNGGTTAPGSLIHSQSYVGTGSGDFVSYELNNPVAITGTENIWVIFCNDMGATFPAAHCAFTGDANGSWISMDGNTWNDVANPDVYGEPLTWMVRAYAGYAKGETTSVEPIEFNNIATGNAPLMATNEAAGSKAPILSHYNIYRGTSANDFELIGESEEGEYFDAINEEGEFYYQVTAVYEENGETCESEPANSYLDSEQNYVVVNVVSIDENDINGMMIYPNPTKDKVMISAEGIERITVTNALGQIMLDQVVSSDNVELNMSQYEAGVYMVRITTESGLAVERITLVK